jgi:hypothetical protein
MSGSPIYVDDGGTSRLVGAVSYGSDFTLGGLGLATPIEYMIAVQDQYSPEPTAPVPGVYGLSRPVQTSEGTLRRVVIAADAQAADGPEAAAGEIVMMPLGLIEIGGVKPQSRAYQDLASKLKRSGMAVRAASGGGNYEGPPAPPLEPGSPCCVLFAEGDAWYGAAGTVTFVDGSDVLVFGHPLAWLGATDAILTAGYVNGSWPSSWWPYLMIAPRNEIGTVTQDRYWGVLADLSRQPRLVPVTVQATYPAEGRGSTRTSNMAAGLIESPFWCTLPADVVMDGLTVTNNAWLYPGSAVTRATVVVHDDTGSYTITRDNVWDSSEDVAWDASYDIADMLSSLVMDGDGVTHPHIDSVDMKAEVSPLRRSARMATVELPNGLRVGDNVVVVKYYPYGSADLAEVQGTLTIPKGMPLDGRLSVYPGAWGSDYWDYYDEWYWGYGEADPTPPRTLAQIVEAIQSAAVNSDLLVSFEPRGYESEDEEAPVTADGRIATGHVFNSEFYQSTAAIDLYSSRRTVAYDGSVSLYGLVRRVSEDMPVRIYRVDSGTDEEVFLKEVTAVYDDGGATFATRVRGLRHNCRLVARCGATERTLPGCGSTAIRVKARVRLHATLSGGKGVLTVTVRPGDAAGKLVVQRRVSGRWVAWRTFHRDGSSGTTTIRLGRGVYVLRARFSGSNACVANISKAITVTVR